MARISVLTNISWVARLQCRIETSNRHVKPNRYGILPRYDPKPEKARWFNILTNHVSGHLVNGFEGEDDCIDIDAFVADYDVFKIFPNTHTSRLGSSAGKKWRLG